MQIPTGSYYSPEDTLKFVFRASPALRYFEEGRFPTFYVVSIVSSVNTGQSLRARGTTLLYLKSFFVVCF